MLKTFTASLIPAIALASNETTFILSNGTTLAYTKEANIKGDADQQNQLVGDLKFSISKETNTEQEPSENRFPENVELGLCLKYAEDQQSILKPEYDCMRVRFNIEYDESDEAGAQFTRKELKLQDGFVMKESEVGKKEAFQMSETIEGQAFNDEQDWMEQDDGQPRASVILDSCTLTAKEEAENVWKFDCEVDIKFARDFDTDDFLDTNLSWSDSLKPHQYNVIAWSSFNDETDFSGEPQHQETSEAQQIQLVDDDFYFPSDLAKLKDLQETFGGLEKRMVTTVEYLKSLRDSLEEEVADQEKWIEENKITLKTEDGKKHTQLENKVAEYEDKLAELETEINKVSALNTRIQDAKPEDYEALQIEADQKITSATEQITNWYTDENVADMNEFQKDFFSFLKTLRGYSKEGAFAIMTCSATLAATASALMF